jgi:hypothetical protein
VQHTYHWIPSTTIGRATGLISIEALIVVAARRGTSWTFMPVAQRQRRVLLLLLLLLLVLVGRQVG